MSPPTWYKVFVAVLFPHSDHNDMVPDGKNSGVFLGFVGSEPLTLSATLVDHCLLKFVVHGSDIAQAFPEPP